MGPCRAFVFPTRVPIRVPVRVPVRVPIRICTRRTRGSMSFGGLGFKMNFGGLGFSKKTAQGLGLGV